eukprot:2409159-Pyramimonas_sp.AAC.1
MASISGYLAHVRDVWQCRIFDGRRRVCEAPTSPGLPRHAISGALAGQSLCPRQASQNQESGSSGYI